MRNTTFISSMVLSVACVSAANAAVVYDTIDPFTEPASATTGSGTYSGNVNSVLTGTLWDIRTISSRTSSASRAQSSMTIASGSAVFGVTQEGVASTASNNVQRGFLDYSTATGNAFPDFTNFTSLDFNYVSTLGGTLKCVIRFADATNNPVEKTISGSSGLMSFTVADFGGIDPLNIAAVGPLSIEFVRSGSNASGSLTITNLVANGASIPAPGAIALLGAAGLIGGRRRRD